MIGAVAFSLVWFFCFLFSKSSSIFYVLDEVTDRSLHSEPKPRTGGIAITSTILFFWVLIVLVLKDQQSHYFAMVGMVILSIISHLDDRNSISQFWRLMVHFLVAVLMVCSLFQLSVDAMANIVAMKYWFVISTFLVLVIVWSINLYNFMDGSDGLAGGMGVIGFSCLAWFGWSTENQLYFLLAITIAAANLGFLVHNFPPAKLFMGDVGSTVMGYLVAFFSLWGIQATIFSWWVPVLIFSPFFVDATVTLLRRILSGERFWQAHKSHYYQKLVELGLGHAKTVMFEYILMFFAACTAICIHLVDDNVLSAVLLLIWLAIFVLICRFVDQLVAKSEVLD